MTPHHTVHGTAGRSSKFFVAALLHGAWLPAQPDVFYLIHALRTHHRAVVGVAGL